MNLLTWNIQAAIGTKRYRDYVLHAHRQVMHTSAKAATLEHIGEIIAPFDLVCLQEVDLGGWRAGMRSQVDDIMAVSQHPYMAVQENRVVGRISRHGNAILSRFPLHGVRDLKLPGRFAGRGCLLADVETEAPFRIACLHLSLGGADQQAQLAAVASMIEGADAWVTAGDFNCAARSTPFEAFRHATGGKIPPYPIPTYPAWRPRRDYDHMVAGGRLRLTEYRSERAVLSDHLPLAAKIEAIP